MNDQCISIHSRSDLHVPDIDDINLVAKLFGEGRYKEAELLCADLTARLPANNRAFYLYGLCSYKNGNLENCAEQFNRAIALNPKDFDSHFNLGIAFWELKRYDDAVKAYQSLLAKAPHYIKALPNLAQALIKTGRYQEGVAVFHRALQMNPQDTRTAVLLMEFECLYLPMAERIAACNKTLEVKDLSDSSRHTALLYRATAEWAAQDMAALASSLSEASLIRPLQGDEGFMNMTIYKTFITKLLDYRKNNPSLYAGQGAPLFLVGDSHSLTYAGLPVRWNGTDYKIDSHLIIGTQAWHIASTEPEVKREALRHHIARLPANAKLLCAFGEIDCRLNHGILPYCKKTGADLATVVAGLVERYVACVLAMAAPKSIDLIFLSVPAPQPASGDRQKVIALFNQELSRRSEESGHHYIDLYAPTLGQGGASLGKQHIDHYHLKPEALKLALQGEV